MAKTTQNNSILNLKARSRKLTMLASILEDFESSNKYDRERIEETEKKIEDGEELASWEIDSIENRKADIKAREELIATLANITL